MSNLKSKQKSTTDKPLATISRFQVYERNPLYNPNRVTTQEEKVIFEKVKEYKKAPPVHLLKTDPIIQDGVQVRPSTQANRKKPELAERKSCVFDLDSDVRKKVEEQWRPLVHKLVPKESPYYDENVKRQLKTVALTQTTAYTRNPITDGDQKSLYVKKHRVSQQNLPKDQLRF